VLFDRRGIGVPHSLLKLAPGLGDFNELTTLVDFAFAARRQPLIDQPGSADAVRRLASPLLLRAVLFS
jgi:hypothetical protein